ncbi:conserved hypothetical protein [Histoplasma capsulatum G186AR]|uniref:Uncharacterized protein n=1 Tax=Ajellomyces capsulatus (strain G186AR / H82 / ATCC MYA-2454 / RMSCC 2432) TaxID=447093 RepID=C0NMV7_AJECG|nr:uncharacterized protein HCBG_04084 [Histoplasma capsulatum G186AR]EEH07205.1 conserved hypothetical protein [Histoplasma capsulatum G186AR]
MSGSQLPATPISEHKKTLHSQSRVPQSIPSVTEQESISEAEGDQIKYTMAEDDMTISGSAHNTGKMSEHKEFKDSTLSSISISTSNSNSMVIMAAADLIALCKQLISAHVLPSPLSSSPPPPSSSNPIPEEDLNMLAHKYQKKAQASLNTKSIITFNGTNYQTWKMAFFLDAEVISGADILNKNQQKSSEGLSTLKQQY